MANSTSVTMKEASLRGDECARSNRFSDDPNGFIFHAFVGIHMFLVLIGIALCVISFNKLFVEPKSKVSTVSKRLRRICFSCIICWTLSSSLHAVQFCYRWYNCINTNMFNDSQSLIFNGLVWSTVIKSFGIFFTCFKCQIKHNGLYVYYLY